MARGGWTVNTVSTNVEKVMRGGVLIIVSEKVTVILNLTHWNDRMWKVLNGFGIVFINTCKENLRSFF